jgi:hypothetical protein
MRTVLTTLVLATAVVASPALADTIAYREAHVNINVPDGWRASNDDGNITLHDRHQDVAISFTAVDAGAVKQASHYLKHMLADRIDNLTLSDPQDITVNGMAGVALSGDGLLNGVNIDLAIIVLDTPSETNDLIVFALGEDAKLARHADEVQQIFHRLRPRD